MRQRRKREFRFGVKPPKSPVSGRRKDAIRTYDLPGGGFAHEQVIAGSVELILVDLAPRIAADCTGPRQLLGFNA